MSDPAKDIVFSSENSKAFRIHPDPEVGRGIDVAIRNDGHVGLWPCSDDLKGFALTWAAALQLADLIASEVVLGVDIAGEPEEGGEE